MYQIIRNVFYKEQNGTKAVETQIQQTPCKAFEDLKSTPRRLRKRKYEEAFRNATSEVHGDIKSVKVTLELRNTLSFYPRQDEKKIIMCLKIIYQTPEGPQTHPESNLNKRQIYNIRRSLGLIAHAWSNFSQQKQHCS